MYVDGAIRALESINGEYIELQASKEMRLGRRLYRIGDAIKTGNIAKLFEYARSDRAKRKASAVGNPCEDVSTKQPTEIELNEARESSITLYSCITAAYDVPMLPLYLPRYVTPVLYLDEETLRDNPDLQGWTVRKVDVDDAMRRNANRYCKMHPHLLFGSDFSVYTDGEVQVVSDVAEWCAIARSSKTGLALFTHSMRSSIYEEKRACLILKKGHGEAVAKQVEQYRLEGMPDGIGLFEATVVVADLANEIAKTLLEAWWSEFCRWDSGRDQLALPYVLWKAGYSLDDVGILGLNVWRSPKLRIHGMSNHA